MGEGGDGLHLDRVHLLERVVEDTGRVDDLPSEVLVVHVSDEQRLGRERVLKRTKQIGSDVSGRERVARTRASEIGGLTGWTSTSARVTLLMKDDFPTLG